MQKIIYMLCCFVLGANVSFGQIIEEDEEPIILYRADILEMPDSLALNFSICQQAISKKYYIALRVYNLHKDAVILKMPYISILLNKKKLTPKYHNPDEDYYCWRAFIPITEKQAKEKLCFNIKAGLQKRKTNIIVFNLEPKQTPSMSIYAIDSIYINIRLKDTLGNTNLIISQHNYKNYEIYVDTALERNTWTTDDSLTTNCSLVWDFGTARNCKHCPHGLAKILPKQKYDIILPLNIKTPNCERFVTVGAHVHYLGARELYRDYDKTDFPDFIMGRDDYNNVWEYIARKISIGASCFYIE